MYKRKIDYYFISLPNSELIELTGSLEHFYSLCRMYTCPRVALSVRAACRAGYRACRESGRASAARARARGAGGVACGGAGGGCRSGCRARRSLTRVVVCRNR